MRECTRSSPTPPHGKIVPAAERRRTAEAGGRDDCLWSAVAIVLLIGRASTSPGMLLARAVMTGDRKIATRHRALAAAAAVIVRRAASRKPQCWRLAAESVGISDWDGRCAQLFAGTCLSTRSAARDRPVSTCRPAMSGGIALLTEREVRPAPSDPREPASTLRPRLVRRRQSVRSPEQRAAVVGRAARGRSRSRARVVCWSARGRAAGPDVRALTTLPAVSTHARDARDALLRNARYQSTVR